MMKRLLMIVAAAVFVSSCSGSAAKPIPVEPDGGIGDGAQAPAVEVIDEAWLLDHFEAAWSEYGEAVEAGDLDGVNEHRSCPWTADEFADAEAAAWLYFDMTLGDYVRSLEWELVAADVDGEILTMRGVTDFVDEVNAYERKGDTWRKVGGDC